MTIQDFINKHNVMLIKINSMTYLQVNNWAFRVFLGDNRKTEEAVKTLHYQQINGVLDDSNGLQAMPEVDKDLKTLII
jgi:hypothetical protein